MVPRLAGLSFFIHLYKHGKLLVCVTSDKMFHTAAAPPCARGFARSLRDAPLQRFHSIIIGTLDLREEARDNDCLRLRRGNRIPAAGQHRSSTSGIRTALDALVAY